MCLNKWMNIVLFEPEIPANTGNIARTCVLTDTALHLIKPLGFSLDEKHLKRAGLDYWDQLDLHVYEDFDDFLEKNEGAEIFAFSKKAEKRFDREDYPADAYLLFGRETSGLPDEVQDRIEKQVRIPMSDREGMRCLNLSNSAAVGLYEALRQNGFINMR